MIFCERLLPKKIWFLRFLRFFLLLKTAYTVHWLFIDPLTAFTSSVWYFCCMFRRRRLSLEMFLAEESDGSRLFRSLMKKIQTIIYKIECPLLVLVDRLKRCRDFSLAKPRSDQWYGFRSGKCHSFFKIKLRFHASRLLRELRWMKSLLQAFVICK